MKIGSIGKGNVGGALTRLWQQAGHDVRAGGRDDSVADVAAHGDVVLLAVGAEAVEDVLQAAGPLDGKVLIDATNDIDAKFGSLVHAAGSSDRYAASRRWGSRSAMRARSASSFARVKVHSNGRAIWR
jgi:predicted dinucleotide-binding enzyme